MKLRDLLKDIPFTYTAVDLDIDIREVRYDSRAVQPGDLFVAVRGFATDGHAYIGMALKKGAVAVVCEQAGKGIPAVIVPDARAALADIAGNRFDHPSRKLTMVGVTGTNGKTTTTTLVKHILEAEGHKVGLIGTNQNMIGDEVIPTERTTPESYELQALFARMAEAGCTHCVMEVSSHSLVLDRVRGVRFAVGAFTNLTQDHLDFHKTMEAYREAKAKLFTISDKGVVNLDDPVADKMLADATCPCLTFSADKDAADLSAKNIELGASGVSFVAATRDAIARVSLGIPGHFSVENALAALGVCVALGVPLEHAARALGTAHGVKGRAEVVPTDTDYTVLIDYAHAPDGVSNILRTVRGFAKGRVIALFGCGGDRDRTKRPIMGHLAAELSDYCIVTSDNPRTEQPEAIIEDIVAGMKAAKVPVDVICDRRAAIYHALDIAQKDDVIVLMGKGHETYQEIDHVKHHMDEREIVADYFKEKNV
ncbi:UDP-N-acetylmuramoyl-L-alanyl-D-glutamate--2,6-diaminopimelate ligase [Butyricicoccus pullicaecorum]|uniref:UDP-N-acetylmuramoyl-L-alanyl-D-glutamate--2,6-diaminopimelate ligase n=1 Tax=Butyricicoccus pullicaecorum 1.2 TaxID=1203606 RepID=R8VTY1_9FIRM|nr:UDP-N-acetylmuramoyl-L-alanyl-D-glutamate--2,6-diaminopimelate ligase [Butyricicoccus pullicaecorum]EOQ35973.1 UDP-N-acetylmuramyl-tripeptide synthetase [Butyricicoccus pullicaecorum 1.2]SKA61283.1 UDP-N-acetylmuramoylalanyl-D-glutamate--2,6-diaminopimelate ligase [Butyricicoccus pullicaecorum DSM 23266]